MAAAVAAVRSSDSRDGQRGRQRERRRGARRGGAGGRVAVHSIVLKPSESLDESRFTRIAGADFNDPGLGLEGLLGSFASTGLQASNLGDAIDVDNQMLDRRLSHEKPREDCDEAELHPKYREYMKCKIFLGFTSNLVSSGIRDIVRFLAQHPMDLIDSQGHMHGYSDEALLMEHIIGGLVLGDKELGP